jgi:hypothetical protein
MKIMAFLYFNLKMYKIKTMKTQPIPSISGRRRIKDHVERGKWQRPMRDEWQQPWRVSGNSHGE